MTELEEKKSHLGKIIIIALFLVAGLVYLISSQVQAAVNQIVAMFATGDFEIIGDFIARYGVYAALISMLLMIVQAIVAPLPAFLITFANANLFGWVLGAILSWSGAMLGAILCFWIARILGRDVVERLTSKAGLEQVDEFFDKYGSHSVLIARLLPFISFDIVSYAAGLTSMRFVPFVIATGIGQLPATIVYSYVGGMLTGGAKLMVTALLILFALSVLVVLIRQVFKTRPKVQS